MTRSAMTKRGGSLGVIETTADIARGVKALRRRCEVMDGIVALTGQPPLRRYAPDVAGLARIIVGQQLSVASAEAIWRRTADALAPLTAERLVTASDATLRAAGLSASKMCTLRALGHAIQADGLDLSQLASADDETVRERLTAVKGIGPWTSDIFILFCLGRADGWAAGDLALQLAMQRAFSLPDKPAAAETVALAERWRPWRGIAARLLWAYYGLQRRSAGDAPLAASLLLPIPRRIIRPR